MRISDWSSDVCSSDLKAGAPACGLLCMADHEGWHAKETAYFLDREGAASQHLRIFRVNCQLLPLHVTVKQHRAARMQRTGELLLQQIFGNPALRSEEHTSELQSLMRISYAVFCLKKKKNKHD